MKELNLLMLTLISNGKMVLINLNQMVKLVEHEEGTSEEDKIVGSKLTMVTGEDLYVKEDPTTIIKCLCNQENNLSESNQNIINDETKTEETIETVEVEEVN